MPPPDEFLSRLHGITGPELTPLEPASLLAWWTAVALVALSFAGIVIFWPRRSASMMASEIEDTRVAIGKLPSEPSAAGLAEFDGIVRRHLGQVFAIDALPLTTVELLQALPNAASQSWSDVLLPCERARFAGILPTQDAYSELLRRTAMLIQMEAKQIAG